MTLDFRINGQHLSLLGNPFVVAESYDFLEAAFAFSDDWADAPTRKAYFQLGTATPYEVPIAQDPVTLEWAIANTAHINLPTGTWKIWVAGYDSNGDELIQRIPTNDIELYVRPALGFTGGIFPEEYRIAALLQLDQTTPQTFVGGIPKLPADRVIDQDNELADKKYVDDHSAPIPDHNDLTGLQGGSAGEYYHMTQTQNAALHAHSNKTALDAVSGTNTGDQDLSGLELKSNKVTSITSASTDVQYPSAKSVYNSTMRLLISRTIGAGENVSAITWTQDDAGNALALKECKICTFIPVNSMLTGQAGVVGCVLNNQTGNVYTGASSAMSYFSAAAFSKDFGISRLEIDISGGRALARYYYVRGDNGTYTSFYGNRATLFDLTTITRIYLGLFSGLTYFPEGTVIEIYGRTA